MTAGLDVFAPTFTGEVHPFAARFPMLPDDELDDLGADIRANGQLHPILLDRDGVLIDGRNRLAACRLEGIEPVFALFTGNPVALIVSANVARRQMTKYQQAMARAVGLAEQGQRANGRWKRDALSEESTDTGKQYLKRCGAVLDYDAERGTTFADDVLTGALTLDDAYKSVMQARRAEQDAQDAAEHARQAAEERNRVARQQHAELAAGAPDLAQLVTTGHLTLEDARAAWDNRRREELAARATDLKHWNDLVEDITSALAGAKDRNSTPADLPENFPDLGTAIERARQLLNELENLRG